MPHVCCKIQTPAHTLDAFDGISWFSSHLTGSADGAPGGASRSPLSVISVDFLESTNLPPTLTLITSTGKYRITLVACPFSDELPSLAAAVSSANGGGQSTRPLSRQRFCFDLHQATDLADNELNVHDSLVRQRANQAFIDWLPSYNKFSVFKDQVRSAYTTDAQAAGNSALPGNADDASVQREFKTAAASAGSPDLNRAPAADDSKQTGGAPDKFSALFWLLALVESVTAALWILAASAMTLVGYSCMKLRQSACAGHSTAHGIT